MKEATYIEQLQHLGEAVDNLLAALDEVGMYINGLRIKEHEMDSRQDAYLSLLMRIHRNIGGVSVMLPQVMAHDGLRAPISVVFRAALADCTTGLYLATFNEDLPSFKAELDLLDLKFLKFLEAKARHDSGLAMRSGLTLEEAEARRENEVEQYRKVFSHLVASPANTAQPHLTPKDIRANSRQDLLPTDPKRSLGDEDMFAHIQAHQGVKHLDEIHMLQRTFSQVQHFSMASRVLFNAGSEFGIDLWLKSALYLYEMCFFLASLSGVPRDKMPLMAEGEQKLIAFIAPGLEANGDGA